MLAFRRMTPLGLLLALLVLTAAAPRQQTGDPAGQAGVVVRFAEDQVATFCVTLDEPEITGYDLLQRTGLALEVSEVNLGAAVCRLAETGCPAGDCFCQCRGADCQYWSYWHRVDGAWVYSAAGAGLYRVQAGDVDGWSWGPGSVTEAVAPPSLTLADICGAEAATAPPAAEAADPPAGTAVISYAMLGLFLLLLGGGWYVARRRGGA